MNIVFKMKIGGVQVLDGGPVRQAVFTSDALPDEEITWATGTITEAPVITSADWDITKAVSSDVTCSIRLTSTERVRRALLCDPLVMESDRRWFDCKNMRLAKPVNHEENHIILNYTYSTVHPDSNFEIDIVNITTAPPLDYFYIGRECFKAVSFKKILTGRLSYYDQWCVEVERGQLGTDITTIDIPTSGDTKGLLHPFTIKGLEIFQSLPSLPMTVFSESPVSLKTMPIEILRKDMNTGVETVIFKGIIDQINIDQLDIEIISSTGANDFLTRKFTQPNLNHSYTTRTIEEANDVDVVIPNEQYNQNLNANMTLFKKAGLSDPHLFHRDKEREDSFSGNIVKSLYIHNTAKAPFAVYPFNQGCFNKPVYNPYFRNGTEFFPIGSSGPVMFVNPNSLVFGVNPPVMDERRSSPKDNVGSLNTTSDVPYGKYFTTGATNLNLWYITDSRAFLSGGEYIADGGKSDGMWSTSTVGYWPVRYVMVRGNGESTTSNFNYKGAGAELLKQVKDYNILGDAGPDSYSIIKVNTINGATNYESVAPASRLYTRSLCRYMHYVNLDDPNPMTPAFKLKTGEFIGDDVYLTNESQTVPTIPVLTNAQLNSGKCNLPQVFVPSNMYIVPRLYRDRSLSLQNSEPSLSTTAWRRLVDAFLSPIGHVGNMEGLDRYLLLSSQKHCRIPIDTNSVRDVMVGKLNRFRREIETNGRYVEPQQTEPPNEPISQSDLDLIAGTIIPLTSGYLPPEFWFDRSLGDIYMKDLYQIFAMPFVCKSDGTFRALDLSSEVIKGQKLTIDHLVSDGVDLSGTPDSLSSILLNNIPPSDVIQTDKTSYFARTSSKGAIPVTSDKSTRHLIQAIGGNNIYNDVSSGKALELDLGKNPWITSNRDVHMKLADWENPRAAMRKTHLLNRARSIPSLVLEFTKFCWRESFDNIIDLSPTIILTVDIDWKCEVGDIFEVDLPNMPNTDGTFGNNPNTQRRDLPHAILLERGYDYGKGTSEIKFKLKNWKNEHTLRYLPY